MLYNALGNPVSGTGVVFVPKYIVVISIQLSPGWGHLLNLSLNQWCWAYFKLLRFHP